MIERLDRPEVAASLFGSWPEAILWSCLQGVMGAVYGDHLEKPKAAAAVLGDFAFLAGEPSKELLGWAERYLGTPGRLLIPKDIGWHHKLEAVFGSKIQQRMRYRIKKEPKVFDRSRLKAMSQELPEGCRLRRIDRQLYQICLTQEWSRDLVSQYSDYEIYKRKGCGWVVLNGDELVSGASSYASYKGGIEIEIDTRSDFQRRGLAVACGARLILECLEKGIYPSWDAHTQTSVFLAQKLGYHSDIPYVVYEVKR